MRKAIFHTVHSYGNKISGTIYKCVMMVFIILSTIPIVTKDTPSYYIIIDQICLGVFVLDYILRWVTADYKFGEKGIKPFLKYPFRLISIIDMLAIFALGVTVLNVFVNTSIARALSVFRIIRILRYSKTVRTIMDILRKSKKPLTAVGGLAVGYILISAIIMFNVEPESFETFFDAVYWSTVSLTTVGYGDIYPISMFGRAVAMISSFFGIAVVALPAGIVTAEYMNNIRDNLNPNSNNQDEQ